MFRKICALVSVCAFSILTSGCALISTAIGAAAAYGISQAFKK